MSPSVEVRVIKTERVFSRTPANQERAVALSLLDATTANFALTNAIWLFERPEVDVVTPAADGARGSDVAEHLRQTLGIALDAYPQWCGQLKSVDVVDGAVVAEAKDFPVHARRFGRVYAHFGQKADVGVEFAAATSSANLKSLYPAARTEKQPLWSRQHDQLSHFVPSCDIVQALQPNEPDAAAAGLRKPLMAVQCTQLACGGFILAVKTAHPLADISGLIQFVKDWASVSRAVVTGAAMPDLNPVFDPERLDSLAAGDINAEHPDPAIITQTESLPLHRYDWWVAPGKPPAPFAAEPLLPAGKPMPWAEWDLKAPVSDYTVHLDRKQVEFLWEEATKGTPGNSPRISKHDAVLAHVWSCVTRARKLHQDEGPVHCDLVLGVRSAFQLGEAFMGSPIVMMNIEMTGTDVSALEEGAATGVLGPIVRRIRETIATVSSQKSLAAHLHSAAYEQSPQRIWQAFLGRRHILVTTWARAGIYDVEFGLGSRIRYADGIVPNLDGNILIKEAPPSSQEAVSGSRPSWTDNGIDISLHICTEDMERLLQDPLLLPRCEQI